MQDTRHNFQFTNAAVPDMLKLVGMSADVDVRYQVTGEPMPMSNVAFKDASVRRLVFPRRSRFEIHSD